ncbi:MULTISPECIES: hypothetical protein [unclassified Curtobacterium]|uniref:hypothetical protein n=1 Tax=unclassified Curtobacterium TaxID=257496 RepID=UPI0037F64869
MEPTAPLPDEPTGLDPSDLDALDAFGHAALTDAGRDDAPWTDDDDDDIDV